MIGRVRTLFVPYGAGSRRRVGQNASAVAARKRSAGKPKIDITSTMPLSPQGKIFEDYFYVFILLLVSTHSFIFNIQISRAVTRYG
jgi:hypothetical protein